VKPLLCCFAADHSVFPGIPIFPGGLEHDPVFILSNHHQALDPESGAFFFPKIPKGLTK
jgi:hypothetical protein